MSRVVGRERSPCPLESGSDAFAVLLEKYLRQHPYLQQSTKPLEELTPRCMVAKETIQRLVVF